MRELLLGCGHRRTKLIATPGHPFFENLTTLDTNPDCKPDVVFNLDNVNPVFGFKLPFENETFDEIHGYEVLEHVGAQGDYRAFFCEFSEYYRILKPNGLFCATVPKWDGIWAFGDPGHRRIINEGTLVFLSKQQYAEQLGKGPMSDYRSLLGETDFDLVWAETRGDSFCFVLKKIVSR